ncbi:hypothetical protein L195_g031830 [Trifolium pratense]|uniref:Uncharacterized protein n=1 Tax=Trifolium pratense TaxID=57577 RepID=A0A2K3LBH7_TRIPR|nr:hypothetical protein L195_g031830 [Trifolium pratense]
MLWQVVVLKPNVDDPRLPPRDDPTVASEPMVPRRVELSPCIESLPDKDGQAAGPVEQCG